MGLKKKVFQRIKENLKYPSWIVSKRYKNICFLQPKVALTESVYCRKTLRVRPAGRPPPNALENGRFRLIPKFNKDTPKNTLSAKQ